MKQLKERFAIKKIKQLIPLSSKNSFNNVSHHFYHLKRQLNEQKYVHSYIRRTEMSIGHTEISIFVHWRNRNVHWTFKCPFVQWTNRNVHWTFKCPFVQWTNGHCRMLNTSVSYPQGVMLDRITSLQQFWHCKSKMSIGQTEMSIGHSYVHSSKWTNRMSIGHKYMSIRPLDEQKCPLGIQMSIRPMDEWTLSNGNHSSLLSTWGETQSDYVITASLHCNINKCPFVHWTNRKVHWTFICPFVHWTNRNVHWTFKCPFVHSTNRNVH